MGPCSPSISSGARQGRHTVARMSCSCSSRSRVCATSCPAVGRIAVIAPAGACGWTTCQPVRTAPISRTATSDLDEPVLDLARHPARGTRWMATPSPRRPETCASSGSRWCTAGRSGCFAGRRTRRWEWCCSATASIPTPRGPASHLRLVATTASAPGGTATCPTDCAASSHTATPCLLAHRDDLGGRLHQAAVCGDLVHEYDVGWVPGQDGLQRGQVENAAIVDRQRLDARVPTTPAARGWGPTRTPPHPRGHLP